MATCLDGRVHKVSPAGIITTLAGRGTVPGAAGEGGPAISADLGVPYGVTVDAAGSVFIATSDGDFTTNENDRIRMVSGDGIITTVAGTGVFGYSGDGGPATLAQLAGPAGMSV